MKDNLNAKSVDNISIRNSHKRRGKNKMIICKICKRQTIVGETTGKFLTMVYKDPKDETKGKRIFSEEIVCVSCSGECLLK